MARIALLIGVSQYAGEESPFSVSLQDQPARSGRRYRVSGGSFGFEDFLDLNL